MIRAVFNRAFPAPLAAPSVWGKLPAYGDYVTCGAHPEDADAWRHWFEAHPLSSLWDSGVPLEDETRAAASSRWLSTDPPSPSGAGHGLPWCFLMPANALPSAPHLPPEWPVIGVMAHSCDQAGRLHPVVVWQSVSPNWLLNHRHALDWLFWLSSFVLRHALPYSTPEAPNPTPFFDLLEGLWRASAPGVAARFGGGPPVLDEGALTWILAEATPRGQPWRQRHTAEDLLGVRRLPWADWPRVALGPVGGGRRRAYFWQHTATGEYVGLAAPAVGERGETP